MSCELAQMSLCFVGSGFCRGEMSWLDTMAVKTPQKSKILKLSLAGVGKL